MKKLFFITTTLFFSLIFFHANAQKIGTFGSSVTESAGPATFHIPYHDVISYLGYVKEGTEDETRDGKKFYYLYVWIPAYAPELGVRMMSPANNVKVTNPIVSKAYEENKSSKDFFDTYITLEKSDIFDPSDVTNENVKNATWIILDSNDDSHEMPKQPNHKRYNSLLRYGNLTGSADEALIVGLYRIGFTSYKKGDVKGTFLAQIGSPVKLDGVAIAKTIDELRKQMHLQKEEDK